MNSDFAERIIDGVMVPTFRGLPIGRDGTVEWNGVRRRPSAILDAERLQRRADKRNARMLPKRSRQ